LTLDGTVVAGDPTAQAFTGRLALRGTSLTRFLTWAAKDQDLAGAVNSDGPFLLQGQLGLSDKSIALTEAGAEIGDMPLTGEVHYTRGERPLLAVVLEGQEMPSAGSTWGRPTSTYACVPASSTPDVRHCATSMWISALRGAGSRCAPAAS
jgi:hypothetical protein